MFYSIIDDLNTEHNNLFDACRDGNYDIFIIISSWVKCDCYCFYLSHVEPY